tara:strand:+ start:138 stop:611 length:474 start_codon:yes stop_codon:yes gene_type:complete
VSCKKEKNSPVVAMPFSFIGSWDYSQKIYRFADAPFTQLSNGLGCNGETNFTFRTDEFEITIAEGIACGEKFFYVLAYDLVKQNDSTHVLTSDRLIRTNYNPTGEPDFSDIPLIDSEVELIIRSENEFITHLNLPDEPLFEGRTYESSYVRYQRIQN